MTFRFERRAANRGIRSISIIGVDGVGKSTLINELNAQFRHDGAFNIMHLRPRILPSPGQLVRSASKTNVDVSPHAVAPNGYFISILRLLHFVLDYRLYYFLRGMGIYFGRDLKVIDLYDRGVFELLLDPARLRIGPFSRTISLAFKLLPLPDLVFALVAQPALILRRKQELDISEIVRQQKILYQLAERLDFVYLISTDRPISECVDDISTYLSIANDPK